MGTDFLKATGHAGGKADKTYFLCKIINVRGEKNIKQMK